MNLVNGIATLNTKERLSKRREEAVKVNSSCELRVTALDKEQDEL